MGGLLLKNSFQGGGGSTLFFGKFIGQLFYMGGLMIRLCQVGRESFTNVFFNNLHTVNLSVFSNHGRLYTWR